MDYILQEIMGINSKLNRVIDNNGFIALDEK